MSTSTTNPLKRPHSPTHAPRSHRLRAKLSPSAVAQSDSSAASSHSVSEGSALFSTDCVSGSDSASTITANSEVESSESEDDSDSESDCEISDNSDSDSSDSSSETEDEDDEVDADGTMLFDGAHGAQPEFEETEDADGVVRLAPKRHKPAIKATGMRKSGSLRERLTSFLPMLAAANEQLEAERREGRLGARILDLPEEGEGEGEEYIEMVCGYNPLLKRLSKLANFL
jgi:hypothetical protein